ncbi:MAG TPA: hypothetical protein VFF02_05665, partial [Anaeromyxobacteraceae bacterium]|nr:hypothetical protein [Anaeromyxobacteraceae bacterium]
GEIRLLNAFFSWATWATVASRPGKDSSYTNNWPYGDAVFLLLGALPVALAVLLPMARARGAAAAAGKYQR